MHYIIYPDTLFLENFLCNLLFLVFLKSRFFPAATGKRILLTAMITAVSNTLASILFFRCIWVVQVAVLFPVAGLMFCYCMEIRDSRRILYLLYQIILWILVFGGILQTLEQWTELPVWKVLLSVACFTIIFGILEKVLSIYERQNACMREIVLYWDGRSIHFQGFADTGNQLFDPFNKKPVSIISPDAWNELLEDSQPPLYYLIPYKSVGKEHGMIQGAQIDYMVILEGKDSRVIEKPVIAITEQPFTGLFHYSVLLHNEYC